MVSVDGFEPSTLCLKGRYSTAELHALKFVKELYTYINYLLKQPFQKIVVNLLARGLMSNINYYFLGNKFDMLQTKNEREHLFKPTLK